MIKVAVQAIEIAIWISVALLLWNTFYSILFHTELFTWIKEIFQNIAYLIGTQNATWVYILCVGAILILICRWFISWLSTDWHNSPNS